MAQQEIVKQMMEGNKMAFDTSFKAMAVLQEQAERMTDMFLQQAAWLPEDWKKGVNEWVVACKKGRDDFKKAADDNYKRLAELLGSSMK